MSHTGSKFGKTTKFSKGTLRLFLRTPQGEPVPVTMGPQIAQPEQDTNVILLAISHEGGTLTVAVRRGEFSKMLAEHCGVDVTVAVKEAEHE